MDNRYLDYVKEMLFGLLSIDSPSGFTLEVAEYASGQLRSLGYSPELTVKGGVFCRIGGEGSENGLLLDAHIDTLGAMVRRIKPDGRLLIKPIGGLAASNIETEYAKVYTRDGRTYDATAQLVNASIHVNGEAAKTERNFDNVEIVLDEDVRSAEDVKALGIENGCYICFAPNTVITQSGYIKSRFLDDKLSAAILLGFAKYVHDEKITLSRPVYIHLTVYEEVGHGAAAMCPDGVNEILAVDMGCVGEGLECTEKTVSICAADTNGPYDYDIICRLVELAKKNGIGYAVDIYPHYFSDCAAAVGSYDLRQALIGAGVYASHGYERSHLDGVRNTFDLLCAYVK